MGNKRYYLILSLLCVIYFGCKEKYYIDNPSEIWTENEVSELDELISLADEILVKKYEVALVSKAYLKFNDFVIENPLTIPLYDEFKGLGKRVSEMTIYDKIWYNNDLYKFNLNPKSQYFSYLKHLGKKDEYLNEYTDKIDSVSDIPPSLVSSFPKNITEIDLNDKNNRLVFIIHYLSLVNR